MFTNVRGWKATVLALVVIALLGLPVAAGAADVANGITSPKDGAKVSGSVDVKGYAADPNFMKWQLDILPGGDANAAAFLALGETAGDFTYTLDTTAYPDGEYALRLRVVTTDSNYKEYLTKFTIANAAATPAAAKPAAAAPTTETAAAEKAEPALVQAGETITATVTVTKNDLLGSFLADEKGRSLYHFTKDTPNTSNCYDQCAQLWPPFLTKGAPKAGAGVNASLLGTTTRKDGSVQVTYNGWPLYYFSKDQKAGDVTGQNVAGIWFVLSPQGEPITKSAAAPAAAAAPAVANGITSPKDGAKVSGSLDVKGYAADPNFMKWQLDILPGSDANAAAFLALGETAGDVSYTLDSTAYPDGEYALRLRVVTSDSNYKEYLTKFTIANAAAKPAAAPAAVTAAPTPAPAAAPVATPPAEAPKAISNGVTSPKEGATLSGAVEVKGNAGDPNFAKWQLDVLPGGDAAAASFLAAGETPGEFTAILDTTAYANGDYALRLRVVRSDSNYDEYITKFTIANAALKAQVLAPGKYLRQGTQDRALVFNKNGTLVPMLLPDTVLANATYTVKGDVYTETSNDQGCITNRNYKYTFDGTKLVFTPLEVYDPAKDTCAGRADDFNPNVTWVLFK